jgi:hypothetical protein
MMTLLDASSPASRLYERVSRVIPPFEWPAFEADVEAILKLKRERDAIILAHNGIVTLAREERERTIRGTDFHAAATTSRHVVIAAARSTRCD